MDVQFIIFFLKKCITKLFIFKNGLNKSKVTVKWTSCWKILAFMLVDRFFGGHLVEKICRFMFFGR